MEDKRSESKPVVSRLITCVPSNQRDMAAAVKAWPALHETIKHLQAQDLFPGLRALRITVTGSEELVAQGLGAITTINAPKGE